MKATLKTLWGKKQKANHPKDWKLIGFYDSPDVNSQLVLIAFGMGEGKSELVRRIVADWLKRYPNAVKLAVKQIKSTQGEETDLAFKRRLEKYLKMKGVSKKYIDQVLRNLSIA